MTPSDVSDGARRAAEATTRALRELTPGQRWTTSLMLGLALIVLAFGLPSATRTVFPAAADEAGEESAAPDAQVEATPELTLTETLIRPHAPEPTPSAPTPTVGDQGAETDPAPVPFAVVALIDPAVGFGDRTDEAMAKRYLATAGVQASFVPIAEASTTCAAAKDATLVITGGPLPSAIRDCLGAAGIASLSFDDDAPLGPVERALSTRRGVARSLFDTAARASELPGKLALVADERFRSLLEPLLPSVRSAGLDITSTAWLAPGEPPASVALSLAGAGLSGVLFATSTQNQSTVGSQLRTLAPSLRLAVLDAADSVLSAGYAPLFDGALAVTSVQLPWHPGAEAQRAACRATWETAQVPPVALGAAELQRALTWCQHAAMADAARAHASGGLAGALLALQVTSPVTSALGRLKDGGYGPTAVALATWSAGCGCWASSDRFEPSRSAHG